MTDDPLLEQFLDRLSSFDGTGAMELVRASAAAEGITSTILTVLAAGQLEVGRRWEFAEWTVSQEHAATSVIDDAIGMLRSQLTPTPDGPHVAVVCAEGEWHVTPARMAALLLAQQGWRVSMLGPSTPAPHLARTLASLHPDVVALSCTLPLNLPGARRSVEVAHNLGIPVVVGGAAVEGHPARALAIGADGAGGLTEVEPQMRSWAEHGAALREGTEHHQQEVLTLRMHRPQFVGRSYTRLLADVPGLQSATDEQLARTREDLDYILRFVEVALDVDDTTVLTDFLGWLVGLLSVRGVPTKAVTAGLDALAAEVDPDLERTQELLALARRSVDSSTAPEDR